MAPTFVHGKNWGVLAGGFNLGRLVSDSNEAFTVDTAGANVFGDTDHAFYAGPRNGTVTLNGFADASTAVAEYRDTWAGTLGSTSPIPITWGQGTVQSRVRMLNAIPTQADISAPIGDMVKTTFSAQAERGVRTGWLLRVLAQRTSTGSATGFDWRGSPSTVAQEIFAHLHVTATSQVTTATVKVQHSSNNTAWSDVLTFANSTGVRGERKSATGTTLKRYVRETLSALAGTSPKITYAVSLSRPLETAASP